MSRLMCMRHLPKSGFVHHSELNLKLVYRWKFYEIGTSTSGIQSDMRWFAL